MDPSSNSRLPGLMAAAVQHPSSSVSQSQREARFAPNPFQYNGRVAVALVPCMLLLVGAGGQAVAGTLCVGLMVSYILDSLQLKEAALSSVWISLLGVVVALGLSAPGGPALSMALQALLLLGALAVAFLCGLWASLQFRWLLIKHPGVALAMERLLFAACPFIGTAVQTWGIVGAVGAASAPFYFLPVLGSLYWLFALPTPTSFQSKAAERSYGGVMSEDSLIAAPFESFLHAAFLVLLPPLFYVAVHHSPLLAFSTVDELWNAVLLTAAPIAFLCLASTWGALWWLHAGAPALRRIQVIAGAVALAALIAALEARVIFHSFGQYIHLHTPWNYILVSVALYGGAAAGGAYFFGVVGGTKGPSPVLFSAALAAAALCGALAVGMPLKLIAAPLVAAVYLGQYYQSKSLVSYAVFTAGAAASFAWFLVRHFWHIQADLGGMPLRQACRFLMASVVLALALPGLVRAGQQYRGFTGLLMVAQALIICLLEDKFYGHAHDEEGLYPGYLVAVTSALGVALSHRLEAEGRLSPLFGWLLLCLYGGKLALLLLLAQGVLWSAVLLALAITPPVLLYRERARPSARSRMKGWQGGVHAGVVALAVWFCRFTVFDALYAWSGIRPSDGLLLGTLVLVTGLACTPIVVYHFPNSQAAKRPVVLTIATGALLSVLQPPVPRSWAMWFDGEHIPAHFADDPEIYGSVTAGGGAPAGWSSWLLLATVVASLGAATSALPVQRSAPVRLMYAVGMGVSLGVYLCASYFTEAHLLHPLLVIACTCACIFLVFTHHPSASSPRYMPLLFALFTALLPICYLLPQVAAITRRAAPKEALSGQVVSEEELRLVGARTAVLALYAAAYMLMALVLKLKLAVLTRAPERRPSYKEPSTYEKAFMPQHRVTATQRPSLSAGLSVKKLAAEGAWMPAVGNVATLLCFALALFLNKDFTGGSDRSIFFLAPILLLLNQDTNLMTSFTDRQRYFPITLAISSFLFCSAGYRLGVTIFQGRGFLASIGGRAGFLMYVGKNAVLLLLAAPNHVLFNKFMWDNGRLADMVLLVATPLNLPAFVVADLPTVRVVAALGVVYAVVQYLTARHSRLAGLRFL